MIKLKSLLTEQSAEWENVTTGTGGGKEFVKQFAASYQLTYPNAGELRLGDSFAIARPVYVGATMQANYNPAAKFATQAGNAASGKFGYILTVFLSTVKNGTVAQATNSGDTKSFPLFTIRCAQDANKKFLFMIQAQKNFAPAISGLAYKTDMIGTANILGTNMIFANIDGWFGTFRKDINTELIKWGYPAIPNSVTYSMTM